MAELPDQTGRRSRPDSQSPEVDPSATTTVTSKGFLLALFDRLFSLPPVSKRRMLGGPLRFIFADTNFSAASDDTYIYYLTAIRTFIGCFFLALLNVVSHLTGTAFDLGLFTIDATGANFAEQFVLTYTDYASIVAYAMVVYHIILFFKHVNITKFDVFWWHSQTGNGVRFSRLQFFFFGTPLLCLVLTTPWISFGIPAVIAKWYRFVDSEQYFYLMIVVMPALLAFTARICVNITAIYVYRLYMGNNYNPYTYQNEFTKRGRQ